MILKGKGGANTTTGLKFEKRINILDFLSSKKGYEIKKNIIYFNGKEVARSYAKRGLYEFLKSKGIEWNKIISAQMLPDEAIYVIVNNTLYVVEMKFQQVGGSVDEKLQTCDFKKKQYQKLMSAVNINVNYIYILGDWFRSPRYKDVLDYVISVGCQYYFEYLPLKQIGLPVPEE